MTQQFAVAIDWPLYHFEGFFALNYYYSQITKPYYLDNRSTTSPFAIKKPV